MLPIIAKNGVMGEFIKGNIIIKEKITCFLYDGNQILLNYIKITEDNYHLEERPSYTFSSAFPFLLTTSHVTAGR